MDQKRRETWKNHKANSTWDIPIALILFQLENLQINSDFQMMQLLEKFCETVILGKHWFFNNLLWRFSYGLRFYICIVHIYFT